MEFTTPLVTAEHRPPDPGGERWARLAQSREHEQSARDATFAEQLRGITSREPEESSYRETDAPKDGHNTRGARGEEEKLSAEKVSREHPSTEKAYADTVSSRPSPGDAAKEESAKKKGAQEESTREESYGVPPEGHPVATVPAAHLEKGYGTKNTGEKGIHTTVDKGETPGNSRKTASPGNHGEKTASPATSPENGLEKAGVKAPWRPDGAGAHREAHHTDDPAGVAGKEGVSKGLSAGEAAAVQPFLAGGEKNGTVHGAGAADDTNGSRKSAGFTGDTAVEESRESGKPRENDGMLAAHRVVDVPSGRESHRSRAADSRETPRVQRMRSSRGTAGVEHRTTDRAGSEGSLTETSRTGDSPVVREVNVDLGGSDGGNRLEGGAQPATVRDPGSPGATQVPLDNLARRLNGDLGDTIVRQARVILHDADKAEIRLIIRPPELGRVRIQLQMEQGHIAGRILVDNATVRQVVEQNLAALERAFAEAGLEMGSLDVQTGDARQQGDQTDGSRSSAGFAGHPGAAQFDQHVPPVAQYDYGNRHINLVA